MYVKEVTKWYATVLDFLLAIGVATENLVKSHFMVRIYAFPSKVRVNGPTTSINTFSNGSIAVVLIVIGCFVLRLENCLT
jgi:hypothetical protein